ncbi:MAG: metallophosphoesterase family protein [Candidatus Promineifilaceae bacterium]|nr:metallophosphoesterase family protein [Candidatus Promineifilaceae bacterium]
MKIAVISDIHGNVPALHAVKEHLESWQPDMVIVNGDTVNRGPCSRGALRFVLGKQDSEDWVVLRGNHEDYLLECSRPEMTQPGPRYEINRFAHFAYRQLNGELEALVNLPDRFSWVAPDGSEFRVVHASMRSNRDGVYKELSDKELHKKIAPAPAVFVTGHTHQPLIRHLDQTLVVNAGSVGAPFDLDWRPSYGRFTWSASRGWQSEIARVPYDRHLVEQDYVRSGFLTAGGPLAQLMLVELRRARGQIYHWASQYEAAVLKQEISIEESVRRVLLEDANRPFLGSPGWTF